MEYEEFKDRHANDPYTHLIARMRADAWSDGFIEARRMVEAGATADDLRRHEGVELRDLAYEALTNRAIKAERDMVATLATLGPLIGPKA
jgi:hypothetical protein